MQFYGISVMHPYTQSGRSMSGCAGYNARLKKNVKFAKAQQAKQVYQYPTHPNID